MKHHPSVEERFWAKVVKRGDDECWEWQAARAPFGYGVLRVGGRRGRTWRAHRWLWTQLYGPLSAGECVCHRCDNPPCVNPNHLFVGTRADNNHDMFAKGRRIAAVGERASRTRLTAAEVLEIRATYKGRRGERKVVCAKYGIHKNTIHAIIARQTWRHV